MIFGRKGTKERAVVKFFYSDFLWVIFNACIKNNLQKNRVFKSLNSIVNGKKEVIMK